MAGRPWNPSDYARLRWWLLVVGDLLIALLAYRLAFWLRTTVYIPVFQGLLPMGRFDELPHLLILVMASQFVWLHLGGVYDNTDARQGIFPRILRAVLVHVLFMVAVYYFTRQFGFPRSVFFTYFVLDVLLLAAWHSFVRHFVRHRGVVRMLVVGLSRQAEHLIERARAGDFGRVEIVGVVGRAPAGAPLPESFAGYPVLGERENLLQLAREHRADEVILTPQGAWQDDLVDAIAREEDLPARFLVVPSAYEAMIGRLEFLNLEDLLTLELTRDPSSRSLRAAKRLFDMLAGLTLLVVLSPLALLSALLVKVQDGGSILFRQERVGRGGQRFSMVKFRSMRPNAEAETGPVLAVEKDPRVTPWGRFMRATRIDEIPQLWNVVLGDMSFVGPRPERPEFVQRFEQELPGYRERFKVKPGMTGLAQIHGDYRTTAENKLKYDLAYIYHQSLWLDVVLMLETLRVVLTRQGK